MNNDLSLKKLFVLDMDGTIYLDSTPIPGAIEFVEFCKSHGIRIIYFTNNASKNIRMYYEKLRRIGFPVDDGDVYSSADVTRRHAGAGGIVRFGRHRTHRRQPRRHSGIVVRHHADVRKAG